MKSFCPAKFGYWLGYQVVKSCSKEYSVSEMMTWAPEMIKNKALFQIKK